MKLKHYIAVLAVLILFMGSGCEMDHRSKDNGSTGGTTSNNNEVDPDTGVKYLDSSDIYTESEISVYGTDSHGIMLSGDSKSYSYVRIIKEGDSYSASADIYGTNSAVLATNEASLTLTDSLAVTSGEKAHAVFACASSTGADITGSVIITTGNNSAGLFSSLEGNINATNATIETYGALSPALCLKRAGVMSFNEGKCTASSFDSPVIYTATGGNVSVTSSLLEAENAQGVVIDGKSTVALSGSYIFADDTQSKDRRQAVLIYNSESGDKARYRGIFTSDGGGIYNEKGDVFFITNTAADITLNGTEIINNDPDGALLRAESSDCGNEGGKANLRIQNQTVTGNIIADSNSALNVYIYDASTLTGAINAENSGAEIFVDVTGAKWQLTEDSYITSLTCDNNSIILDGHTLYVKGNAYPAESALKGRAVTLPDDSENYGYESEFVQGDDSENTDITDNTDTDNTDNTDNTDTDNTDTDNTDNTDTDNTDNSDNTDNTDNTETTEEEIPPLTFSALKYTTGTANGVAYRAYTNLAYASDPLNANYQRMSIYIPEPYFSSRPVNGYTASTAPIFMPNNSTAFIAGTSITPTDTNSAGIALSRGLVVVCPAMRGRNVTEGIAPAAVVDLKAAVRYLRKNKSLLPAGDTDKIIAAGTSSGGAIAAALAASGNSEDFDYWLYEIGAAENVKDDIFAAVVYCPETNLENSDGAYEWTFGDLVASSDADGSKEVADSFIMYVNDSALVNEDSALILEEDGSGSFREYIEGLYVSAAQKAINSGTTINADWLKVSGNTVISADLDLYASSFGARLKSFPAYDKLDASSPENAEFGKDHFTDYSFYNSTEGGFAGDDMIKGMNAVKYVGEADTAKHWRIRHGTNDRDTVMAIPAILALKLAGAGCNVDFEAVWDQGHKGDYDLTEMFEWIDSICK